MIETPTIVHTEPQHYAALRLKIPIPEMQQRMGPGIAEVLAALEAQGKTPAGPWFTHHFQRPREFFDFEICFPVAEPIEPHGNVQPRIWSGMTVARTLFHGSYSGLPAAWGELEAWMKENRHSGRGEFWERYLVNPHTENDPAKWQTELNWPLAAEV